MSHIVKLIKERERVTVVRHTREFGYKDKDGGYSFPCEANGKLIQDEHYACWYPNYEMCLAHPEEFIDNGIVEERYTYSEPAIGLCSCGSNVELEDCYMGATECPSCGQWYNVFGQSLLKPKYWEE